MITATRTRVLRTGFVLTLATLATLAMWNIDVIARSGGVSGVAQSATGCSCHSSSPNANGAVTVSITGPLMVAPGSTNSYTISASGGPSGTTGGVDLKATGGTLVAGAGTQISATELVHTDNTRRSWTFSWTAPATDGNYSFYAVGMSSSGSGSSGDSWNWYGGAVNTPYTIAVNSNVGVEAGATDRLWLAPAAPNPSRGPAQITFGLPESGSVRLQVFDLNGRLIATPAAGVYPGGLHVTAWAGVDDRGRNVASGRYIIRLSAGARVLTRSLTILR